MRATFSLVAALALGSGCVVSLEGAPCDDDSNCPQSQWCTDQGKCTERPPTLEEACSQVVRMGIRRSASCLTGREEAWAQAVPQTELCGALGASVAAGTLRFDPSRIRQCKAAILGRDCDGLSIPGILEGCEMFIPASALGGACRTPYDCSDGWCKVESACPGTCTAFTADDQPCTTSDRCASTSTCANGFCRRYRQATEACSADAPCDPFLAYCNGNPTGTCLAKRQSGSCTLLECAPTYRCTPPLIGTCQPAKILGQPCTSGQYQCETFSHCSNVTNQCEMYATTGGQCGALEGELLVGCLGSRCVLGTCANFVASFGSCNANADCSPLAHCAANVCTPDFCAP